MKSQLSSMDLYFLSKELQLLIGAKIDKIYDLAKKQLIINFHVPSKGKKQLFIDAEKTLYLTDFKFPTSNPSDFCMYLRKKLSNARLRSIKQLGFERILDLKFETKEGIYDLILELFSKGNIVLLKSNKILIAADYQKWKDRVIKPKAEFTYPKREYNFLELDEKSLKEMLQKSNKESLVKSLAMDLGLGGIFAEEIIGIAGVDKDKKPAELGNKKIEKIIKAINQIKSKEIKPEIIYEKDYVKDITPFKLNYYKNSRSESANTFSSALDNYFSNLSIAKAREKQEKRLDSIKTIIKSQQLTIKKLENKEKEYTESAELLYQNYETISTLLKELNQISKEHSWQEIKEKLKGHKVIKEVNPKDKTIIVEL